MERRLNRADYLFSLFTVFLLVCIAGAFFYGVKIGREKTEAKYAVIMKNQEEAARIPGAYDQQYLVSFYHSVLSPYREFQLKWFEQLKRLEQTSPSLDPSDVMKDLSRLASQKVNTASKVAMSSSSPLLVEAQQNYMKSLQLFADTLQKYQSKANGMAPTALVAELDKDAFLTEAKRFALQGQQQFYTAMTKWNETMEPKIPGLESLSKTPLTVKEWAGMSLIVKNNASANLVLNSRWFAPVYPQDITSRIEELIASGQAKKMNLNDISAIVDMLLGTNAVRQGDFIQSKLKYYNGETLPQLPFFAEP
ncbi:hypothetical protein [Paenibacillus koleovorans]|uniref:hypothetical protein n=1 Tax=Paenibacillus koleovorans TaxID=121608 RepID=UPI000FD7A5C8|nr:hypothetical protein [Paenibacillus koleovorans]